MRSTTTIPLDTSRDVDQMMAEKFASMSVAERAVITAELNDMCTKLALAGIRAQHGDLPEGQVRWHLAARRYGEQLTNEAYGTQSHS